MANAATRTVKGKLVHTDLNSAPLVQGRRAFFAYRDLGVADASEGMLKAQVQQTKKGLGEPTGWHYHTCDGQFVYVLKGWVDLEFATGEKLRLDEGHSCYIPGGLIHNETGMSLDFEVLEVHLPADRMGTVPVDAPF